MSKINTAEYKSQLEKELSLVVEELKTVGVQDPNNPSDWVPVPPSAENILQADDTEMADRMETYEENTGILKQLEIRYNEIKNAIQRIEDGTYGVCEVGGEQIEEDRLKANPAARTCKQHMN